jgi:hypothetical protein
MHLNLQRFHLALVVTLSFDDYSPPFAFSMLRQLCFHDRFLRIFSTSVSIFACVHSPRLSAPTIPSPTFLRFIQTGVSDSVSRFPGNTKQHPTGKHLDTFLLFALLLISIANKTKPFCITLTPGFELLSLQPYTYSTNVQIIFRHCRSTLRNVVHVIGSGAFLLPETSHVCDYNERVRAQTDAVPGLSRYLPDVHQDSGRASPRPRVSSRANAANDKEPLPLVPQSSALKLVSFECCN